MNLVAEWFSGQHELGNLIAGFTWHPNHTWIFVLGWKVPTRYGSIDVNDMAVVAEVGLFFPTIGGRRAEDRSVFDDEEDETGEGTPVPAGGPTPHPRRSQGLHADPAAGVAQPESGRHAPRS